MDIERIRLKNNEIKKKRGVFEKISLYITLLEPKSARRVFDFIDTFFQTELNSKVFKIKFWDYNVAEQYFIIYYLKLHFGLNQKYSFFEKFVEDKRQQYQNADAITEFDDWSDAIYKNRRSLVRQFKKVEKTTERRFKELINLNVPYQRYDEYYRETHFDYRIPLYCKKEEFREFFLREMQEFITKRDAEDMFRNSFESVNNRNLVKLLYFEVGGKAEIVKKIKEISNEYSERYLHPNKKWIAKYNNIEFKKLSERQQKLTKKIEPPTRVTHIDFSKVFYNAFPALRDMYPTKDIFLKKYQSNIAIRKR